MSILLYWRPEEDGESHGAHCMLKLAKMLEAIPEEDNLHEAANNLAEGLYYTGIMEWRAY